MDFAVLLPDDLMEPGSRLLRKMIQVREALGGSVVALLKVTPEQATAYASTAVEVLPVPEGVDLEEGQLMRITDVTEKPPLDEVKSEYAVVGRYLLDPAVFTALENIEPGAGGEYQLTDGYARMIGLPEEQGGGLYGVVIDERRFDTGDKLGYLEANVTLALEDPALGGDSGSSFAPSSRTENYAKRCRLLPGLPGRRSRGAPARRQACRRSELRARGGRAGTLQPSGRRPVRV